ncbi:hypothetical protein BDP27DRAFT_1317061 [Rhodocollybia butyracea]|uniref:Uncharacterized protein n=1 Tax=Rhodocollybia butyracea TaxID=206335 RepID=A0A9P5Q432_9AGAR|nr:hypothetical protein BDP27DRAFT_1317061 [Rhodocollybia butyracea]
MDLSNVDPSTSNQAPAKSFDQLFISFQFIGLLGSILTLIAARFSSRQRQATWYNFMGSWVLFCVSYLLLFFTGHAYDGDPGLPLCILQSSLVHAVSPFVVACSLALVIQLFFDISSTLSGNCVGKSRYWRITLIVTPYAILLFLILESIAVSFATHDTEFSSIPYCSYKNKVPGRITSAFAIILALPMIFLVFLLYLRIRKYRQEYGPSVLRAGNSKSMFTRVSAFTLYGVICVAIACLFFLASFLSANGAYTGLDTTLSTFPVAAVLIFGSHKDLLVVWLFWRKKRDDPQFPGKTEPPTPVPAIGVRIDYVEQDNQQP